jgi:pimeloyl-ACP methyl ester carboxylesterase
MPYADIGDVKLFFEVYGSKLKSAGKDTKEKPTFIFLHGGAGYFDHTPYVKFWSRFSDVAEVVFLDQRGSGRSQCNDMSTWNLKQWGKDIYLFCEALGIQKPIVGGISYGGMVAMSYAIQYPDHPLSLILTDTDAYIDKEYMLHLVEEKLKKHNKPIKPGVAATNAMFTGPITDEVFETYFYEVLNLFGKPVEVLDDFSVVDPKYINTKLGEYFLCGELMTFDFRGDLKKTKCPVLFLTGDQGPLHSLKTAKELIASFPKENIQYKIFEGAKPACYELDPLESERLIKAFIG